MASSIFQNLEGSWQIERSIAPGGVVMGEAMFTPISDHEYQYHETGTLTLDHGDVIEGVERAYVYKFVDGQIQIFYADGPDDGTLFQTLTFTSDKYATAEHLCGDDLYQSTYIFELPNSLQITHNVRGPKKDYVSVTIFKRHI